MTVPNSIVADADGDFMPKPSTVCCTSGIPTYQLSTATTAGHDFQGKRCHIVEYPSTAPGAITKVVQFRRGVVTAYCTSFFQILPSSLTITVKASNFGPHGNFGPLFQNGLLSSKHTHQWNGENERFRKTLDLQIRFCSFLVHDSSKEATELAKVQSFHGVQS
jgi:hypothetical protein